MIRTTSLPSPLSSFGVSLSTMLVQEVEEAVISQIITSLTNDITIRL
jgi:hypothetical protein